MLNSVQLQGRLGRDPELKTTTGGKHVCSVSIAVKDFNKTVWVNIVAWEKSAEFLAKHFRKGKEILVEGRLSENVYKDKDGNERKNLEVVVNQIHFAGDKDSENKPKATNTDDVFAEDVESPF